MDVGEYLARPAADLCAEAARCRAKYHDRFPLIIRSATPTDPQPQPYRFLVCGDMLWGAFAAQLRSRLALDPGAALFFFAGAPEVLCAPYASVRALHERHAQASGFLVVSVARENAFG